MFCNPRKNKFKWIRTTVSEMKKMVDWHQISGGYTKFLVKIGNINYMGSIVLGTVYSGEDPDWDGLYIAKVNCSVLQCKTFKLIIFVDYT